MEIKVLQERIAKKELEITKIEKRIAKWTKENDEYELKRANSDLRDAKATLVKYNNMLEVEVQKQQALDEMPEVFNTIKNYLVEKWNEYDIKYRNAVKAEYEKVYELYEQHRYEEYKIAYRTLSRQCRGSIYETIHQTDEEINKQNEKDAKNVILDLINRVSGITGEIENYSHLHTARNNDGYTILNGYVEGKNGTAEVYSIYAGGYNIQRLHIRVLVKKIK